VRNILKDARVVQ